jgi:hypothetical protein
MKKLILIIGIALIAGCDEPDVSSEHNSTGTTANVDSIVNAAHVKDSLEQHRLDSFYKTPIGKMEKIKQDKITKNAEIKREKEAKLEAVQHKKDLIHNGEQIYRHFDQNEVQAEQIYKDHNVNFIGRVHGIGKSFGTSYIIICYDGNDFTGLQCEGNENEIAVLSKGDLVEVNGTCDHKIFNIFIKKCTIKKL